MFDAERALSTNRVGYASWKGVAIVIQRRTLATFVAEVIGARLQIEALVETPFNPALATDAHADPARLVFGCSGQRGADHVPHQGEKAISERWAAQ